MKDSDNCTSENQKAFSTKNKEGGGRTSTANILRAIYALVGTVIFLFVSYHGLNNYIDRRIDNKINNSDFLHELARHVRPSLVFNDNGSIIADMGAVQYIIDIKVSKGDKNSILIIISPNEYLGVEPILESLDAEYSIHAKRGPKFDWIFNLYAIQQLVMESSPDRDNERFRLELIR